MIDGNGRDKNSGVRFNHGRCPCEKLGHDLPQLIFAANVESTHRDGSKRSLRGTIRGLPLDQSLLHRRQGPTMPSHRFAYSSASAMPQALSFMILF